MKIEADQDGKVAIKIETKEDPYGFNKRAGLPVKRTVKIDNLSPYEILEIEIEKGKII